MSRWLIACEESGAVRRAMRSVGVDAWSCDLKPARDGSPFHIQDDVLRHLDEDWDGMIAHPECTYLCNSGVRWLTTQPGRVDKMLRATDFFLRLWKAKIKRKCLENPIPHRHAMLPRYTQLVQPWMFGHPETKATCFWLDNLPNLVPTNIVEGRMARIHRMAPGPNRSRDRSETYSGIAMAFANQWGTL